MNRETLWPIVRERATMDRLDYLDAWGNTGNEAVLCETQAEIDRFNALKGVGFKDALRMDREGVRLAFLSAECWYSGLYDAQVGQEKRKALAAYKRVREVRLKLFGETQNEAMMERCVSVPIHKVGELVKSGLAPTEFLATLKHH
ncbi:hypothetical protein RQP54_17735 [Curvibacter sp. APW13]|uniref:hypothetical protein n=1 Tax=Curvibacter sp. APW13 TaxID=3077236 RepID=UPI0028DE4121|nr:hypothetical protein [Curvibacter sp. APW13]MDT8992718.1 hypothetical protein [Curvibacter sp. APW13]